MLTNAVSAQGFKPVAGRYSQVFQSLRITEHSELAKRGRLNVLRQPATSPTTPDALGFAVSETLDHDYI